MSKTKSTRSTKVKDDAEHGNKPAAAPALRKIFLINEDLLKDGTDLKLERFYHPGKATKTLFVTHMKSKQIYEVIEFAETRRSWLINTDVCSNGRVYMTTPLDINLLVLYHLRKHCKHKAVSLDCIYDNNDASTTRLLENFVNEDELKCMADVKQAGSSSYYKYNHDRTMAWLAVKAHHIAEYLKKANVHCGHSALSQNYVRTEKTTEELVNDMDYLRMACDIVGEYLELELHDELTKYLEIPSEMQALNDEKTAAQKRKSLQTLNGKDNKKLKLEDNDDNATGKLKDSSLLDTSADSLRSPEAKPTSLKERTLTAKEKALAKGAKGTMSISSFFKK